MSSGNLTGTRPPPPTHLAWAPVVTAIIALWWVQPALAATPGERLDAGSEHTCVVLDIGNVRCWGLNSAGQLGYGNTGVVGKTRIGDDETPKTEGPVDFGGPEDQFGERQFEQGLHLLERPVVARAARILRGVDRAEGGVHEVLRSGRPT